MKKGVQSRLNASKIPTEAVRKSMEPLIASVAAKTFEFALSGSRLDTTVRQLLGRDAVKQAFEQSIESAVAANRFRHPDWADSIPEMTANSHEASKILAELLKRDGHPDPLQLAQAWMENLILQRQETKVIWLQQLEQLASDFLTALSDSLKSKPELTEINNARNFEEQTDLLRRVAQRLDADECTPGTRHDYLGWLRAQTLYLNERGTSQAARNVHVELDAVYVSLNAHLDTYGHNASETVEALNRQQSVSSDVSNGFQQGRQALTWDDAEPDESELHVHSPMDLHDVVRRHDRIVILGDPGSGKSTLTRYLALQHADAGVNNQLQIDGIGPARFPILVRVAEFVELGLSKGKSLSDSLADICIYHECPSRGLRDLLETELARGNCLILLDGLDEVISADDRRRAVARIEDFVRRHGAVNNRFVITSRRAGYRDSALEIPFQHFTILEMTRDQIEAFLSQWCLAVATKQLPNAPEEQQRRTAIEQVGGILEAIDASAGVRRLASNPLLLRIMSLVHESVGQLPRKRIELYKIASDTLAKTWRVAQEVPESALAKDEHLVRLLPRIGFWLHQTKSTGLASRREIVDQLGAEWASIQDEVWDSEAPSPDLEDEVKRILRVVEEQTGLLVEKAPQQYGFLHLTFQEYYAARQLVRRSSQSAQLIRSNLHDSRWDEPILLALGFKALDSPDDAIALIQTAILAQSEEAKGLGFEPSANEDLLGRDFLFALRCLGDDIPLDATTKQRLIARLADELLNESGSAQYLRYRRILTTRVRSLRGTETASNILLPKLLEGLQSEDQEVQKRAIHAIEEIQETSFEVIQALTDALYAADDDGRRYAAFALSILGDTSEHAREALTDALKSESFETRFAAAAAFARMMVPAPDAIDALLEAANSENEDHRDTANSFLGILHGKSDVVNSHIANTLSTSSSGPKLSPLLGIRLAARFSPVSEEVRVAILELLHNGSDEDRYLAAMTASAIEALLEESQKVLIDLAMHGGEFQANSAVLALSHFEQPAPGSVQQIAQVLQVRQKTIGVRLANLLVGLAQNDPNARKCLAELFNSGSRDIRFDILFALSRDSLPSWARASVALSLVLDHDASAGIHIFKSLVDQDKHSKAKVETILEAFLAQMDHPAKSNVAKTLVAYGQDTALVRETLFDLVRSDIDKERVEAALALASLGIVENEIVEELRGALMFAEDNEIRFESAQALGEISAANSETIDVLLDGTIKDDTPKVRTTCADSIVKLSRRSPAITNQLTDKIRSLLVDGFQRDSSQNLAGESVPDLLFDVLWRISEVRN
jgi:hypothetical protein